MTLSHRLVEMKRKDKMIDVWNGSEGDTTMKIPLLLPVLAVAIIPRSSTALDQVQCNNMYKD